ncbi:hypothetical protein [Rhizobium sp. rho-13.1]|uniref:hypothetical protein n=1 Tax=Rhizobium sp. rho-13.1 TaxID=2506431 RepID=UPI001FCE990B|nr:hypothetical protein [Rhizobium sp. rho-13.1]
MRKALEIAGCLGRKGFAYRAQQQGYEHQTAGYAVNRVFDLHFISSQQALLAPARF